MIAVSIISLLAYGVSKILQMSMMAYNVNNEANEFTTKTDLCFKRIESKLKKIEKNNFFPRISRIDTVNNEYFEIEYVDKNGVRNNEIPIIRYSYNRANKSIMENSEYVLRSNMLIKENPLNVNICKFYFYKNNINNRLSEITNNSQVSEIQYILIQLELEGVSEKIVHKVGTGISLR